MNGYGGSVLGSPTSQTDGTRESAAASSDQRLPLILMTVLKFMTNGLLRLPYPFIGDLARGLGTTNASIGTFLSVGELAGLAGSLAGPDLDKGRHRRWLSIGFGLCGFGGGVIAGMRSTVGLLIGFCLISIGVNLATMGGHSAIGAMTTFAKRGRAIGIFETSWAAALLVGGYVSGVLIDRYGWWVPFAVFSAGLFLTTPLLISRMDPLTREAAHESDATGGLNSQFNLLAVARVVSLSIVVTFAQVLMFSSMGPFMENRHGFDTKAIGALVVGLGAMELLGSGGTALFTDRLGKRRAILMGLIVMLSGVALMFVLGGNAKVAAVIAILVFFLGFEFAYVSLLAVVSEVGGPRRGAVVAFDHSVVTITRAAGAWIGPRFVGPNAERFRPVHVVIVVLVILASAVASTLQGCSRE
jgi:MFS transporter, DHA1 family, inner membrane transport protein